MQNMFNNLFRKKSATEVTDQANGDTSSNNMTKWSPEYIDMLTTPYVAGSNYMELFRSVSEVFFPIDFIASRVSSANFQLRKVKDDSIVWENKRMNQILVQPNCIQHWNEFIYLHHVYKLATGNSFIRAAMSDVFKDSEKWKYCDNFWVLPANYTEVVPMNGRIPLFGIAGVDEIIKEYRINYYSQSVYPIPVYQIWHDRDGFAEFESGSMFMKSRSRLQSQNKPISNLIAVYEARNVIYVKRGALGFLVNLKRDASGTVAMTENEKKEIITQQYEKYGVSSSKFPYGLSNIPLNFIRTNLSISELMPFEETLSDAISIAGAYGIPSVLVPRKDQSTFSNQATAEKSVYTSIIIPMANKFCKDMTSFLGLESGGYYLDCDFSDVDCLQSGLKEAEDVKTTINNRCKQQFDDGLITLNDWRAQIEESRMEIQLFDKLKYEMSDDELQIIYKVTKGIINTNGGVENE